jgi:hypothetical protein
MEAIAARNTGDRDAGITDILGAPFERDALAGSFGRK